MKFLAFSDLHCSNYKSYSKYKNGKNSRLLTIIDSINEIQKLGKQENVDFYVFGGDLFNTQGYVESDVYNLAFDAFKKFDKEVICISGNHDNFGSSDVSDLSFLKFSEIANVKIIDNACFEKYKICGVGFQKNLNAKDILSCKDFNGCEILVLHEIPKGCVVNDYLFKEGIDWESIEKQFKLVLFGHIHQPKKLSDKTFVIGSPLQHNFSDKGDRGVWLFDHKNGGNYISKFIPLKYPKFFKVDSVKDKSDSFNYYMVSGLDNEKIVEKSDSIVTTEMSIESIVDRYLKSQDVNVVDTDFYRSYGLSLLGKAELECKCLVPSNYKLQKVTLEGFLSFRDKADFEVQDGIWLVLGESDVFLSNGSGKSSLFDSIFYCLYGKTTKGLVGDDVINLEIGKNCKVSIELQDSKTNAVLEVERFRKYGTIGNGLIVKENGKRLEGNVQILEEKLLGILGYDYDFFLNTVYYSQEMTEFFASSSDSEKKSFLDSVLQTEKYGVALKYVRKDLSDLNAKIKDTELTKKIFEDEILVIAQEIVSLEQNGEVFEDERGVRLNELESARITLIENCSVFNIEKIEKTAEIDRTEEKLGKVSKFLEDSVADFNKRKEIFVLESSKLREQMSVLLNGISTKEAKIKNLVKQKVNVTCENCGNLITEGSKEKYVEILNQEVTELSSKQNVLAESLAILNKRQEEDRLKFEQDVLDFRSAKVNLESSLLNIRKRLNEINEKVNSLNLQLAENKAVILVKQNAVNIFEKYKEEKVVSKDSKKEKIIFCDKFLKESVSNKKLYEFFEDAFSTKGIKSLLSYDFCKIFNQEIFSIMSVLSGGFLEINLQGQTKLKSGELSEKLFLGIKLSGREMQYLNLSGGEKRRVDIAVMITLNKIVRRMYNINFGLLGVLILDEIFSFLDSSGEENVFYILQEVSKNVRSIFVITHTNELTSYFDNKIVVKKENNCSFLQN